jgi:hypothetical protein
MLCFKSVFRSELACNTNSTTCLLHRGMPVVNIRNFYVSLCHLTLVKTGNIESLFINQTTAVQNGQGSKE